MAQANGVAVVSLVDAARAYRRAWEAEQEVWRLRLRVCGGDEAEVAAADAAREAAVSAADAARAALLGAARQVEL